MSEDDGFSEAGDVDPFDTEAVEGGPMDGGTEAPGDQPGFIGMLRSSEPEVDPHNIGQSLSVDAPWHGHLGAAFAKMTGSRGAEAWMHILLSAFILWNTHLDGTGDGEQEDSEQTAQAEQSEEETMAGPAGQETFEGPQ